MLPEHESPARTPTQRPSRSAANLPMVDEDGASAEVAALYQRFRRQFGRPDVPGILRCFATHPPLLRAMMDLAPAMLFTDGALTRRHKEMIAAFVSFRNECPYCADSHGYFFREQGGTDAVLCALRENRLAWGEFTDGERTLLEFAEKVNEHSQAIGRADVEAMRRAGWSDLQIAEIIHTVALFAAFNRIANAFGLPSQGLLADSDLQS
jgi:uncharacterized peroxidase-related enzyme